MSCRMLSSKASETHENYPFALTVMHRKNALMYGFAYERRSMRQDLVFSW